MNKLHFDIKETASKRIFYTVHAVNQMNLGNQLISTEEVEYKIFNGEIIEEYPEDKRGHSCLINGKIDSRAIHIVCAPKNDYRAIITAYLPDMEEWEDNFKRRKSL